MSKSKHFCPFCGCTSFITVAHVTEDWLVDSDGNWLETIESGEPVAEPNDDNSWTCRDCGKEAEIVSDLNRPAAAEQCARYLSMLTGKHYNDNILDVPAILENAEGVFSKELVAFVIAATVTRHPTDGRIDPRNRTWALSKINDYSDMSNAVKAADVYADITVYGAHMGFADLLATALRQRGES